MLADYAAGALSQGMSLLVASHLTFCPACRDKAARLEALGGALLAEGESVAPTSRCLREALARIGRPDRVRGAAAGLGRCRGRSASGCGRRSATSTGGRWRPGSRPAGSTGSAPSGSG